MKKSSAWLVLTIYLCASCTGLLPLVLDSMAHVLWHKEHIEHVHHGKEGHNHLADEIVQSLSENQNHDGSFTDTNGVKPNLSAHYVPLPVLQSSESNVGNFLAFPPLHFWLPTGAKATIFLPPKIA